MSEPSGEPDLKDPNTFLPYVIEHLPRVYTNPDLESAVLTLISKASRTHDPKVFAIPLLPHLTAVTFAVPFVQVASYANSILDITRSLVLRRLFREVSSYLVELVSLTKILLDRSNLGPVPFFLPSFNVSDIPPISSKPSAVSAALLVLALHIPSLHTPPVQVSTRNVFRQSSTMSIRLWQMVGQHVRSTILSLASRSELLCGQCGIQIASLCINILLRAFDPASGVPVPAPLRRRVADTAARAFSMNPNSSALLQLLSVTSPSRRIASDVWSSHVLPHVLRPGRASSLARSLSRNGRVDYPSGSLPHSKSARHGSSNSQYSVLENNVETSEPPDKRRRVEMTMTPVQSASSHQSTSQASGAETYQDARVSFRKDAIYPSAPPVTLQRCLKALGSGGRCAKDSKSAMLIAYATHYTADAFVVFGPPSSATVLSELVITDWVGFALHLSRVLVDLAKSVNTELPQEVWYSLLCLATAVIRLYRALRRFVGIDLGGCVSKLRLVDVNLDSWRITACTLLQKSIASYHRNRTGFPFDQLGILLLRIGRDTRFDHPIFADWPTFVTEMSKLSDYMLEPSEPLRPPTRGKVLRGALRAKRAELSFSFEEDRDIPIISSLPALLAYISRQSSNDSGIDPSIMHVLAFEICLSVHCCDFHDYCSVPTAIDNKPSFEKAPWKEVFDVTKSVLSSSHSENLIVASLRCLLCLSIHAPNECFSESLSAIADAFWLQDGRRASSAALQYLSYLLNSENRNPSSKAAEVDVRSPAVTAVSPLGRVQNILLEKLTMHTQKFRELSTSNEDEMYCWEELNSKALSLHLLLPFDGTMMPIISGIVSDILLRALSQELSSCAQLKMNVRDKAPSRDRGNTRMMVVWNHIVSVATMISDNNDLYCEAKRPSQALCSEGLPRNFSPNSGSPIPSVVSLFSSYMKYWAPLSLHHLLDEKHLSLQASIMTGEQDVRTLWMKLSRYVIKPLLQKKDMGTLNKLSAKSGLSLHGLVDKFAADSLAALIMAEGKVPDNTSLISSVLGKPVESLLRSKSGKVVQKLVMEFGGDGEIKAKMALTLIGKALLSERYYMQDEDDFSGAMVANHFMLVMDAVNRGLFQSRGTQVEQARYLGTLNTVLAISKKHVHAFVPKILASLKLALDTFRGDSAVCLETVRVWVSFLHILRTVRVTDHLASIFATLLPYYTRFKDILSEALAPLVDSLLPTKFRDRSLVALFLRLTGHPWFSRAANLLEGSNHHHNDAGLSEKSNLDMKQLEECCKNVCRIIAQYENGFVEVMAAKFFYSLLRANRQTIVDSTKVFWSTMALYEQEVQNGVPYIMKILIEHVYRSKNRECQRILLQCMGEIGAIDPAIIAQFSSRALSPLERSDYTRTRDYPSNVFALVAHLMDGFLIPVLAQSDNQSSSLKSNSNRAGLSVQELLRVCGCRKDTAQRASKTAGAPRTNRIYSWETVLVGETKEENAILFWENLAKVTRDVLYPYLSEPFDVQQYKDVFGGASAGNIQLACQPVWSKIKATTSIGVRTDAHEWRRQFVVQLVDFIGTRGDFGEVFRALRPVLRYVDNVTAFVFPLVLVGVLDIQKENQGNDLELFIIKELSEVLTEASSPLIIFDLLDTLRDWREVRCLMHGKKLATEKFGNGSSGASAAAKRKHAIPIYTEYAKNLDPLSVFIDLDKGRIAPSLSLLVQAKCALRAKSFSRAIFLAENHVRNIRQKKNLTIWPGLLDKVLGKVDTSSNSQSEEAEACIILQKSFAELEDADNMRGIAALRSGSSISELVLDTEVSGQFNETLTLYERAIADDPRNVLFHAGFMRCLMTLGHWETMMSHAQGLVHGTNLEESDLLRTAEANGIEAAWRLSRWDQIKTFTSSITDHAICYDEAEQQDSPSTWALEFSRSFGNLVFALNANDAESFKSMSEICRDHLLPPMLRAAREGYSRAYPIVARLHAVADVVDTFEHFQVSVKGDRAKNTGAINPEQGKDDSTSICLASIESRSRFTAPSLKLREPILSAKRVCMGKLGNDREGALVNLELARLAKENDNLRLAATFSFKAKKMSDGDEDVKNLSVMEYAKIEKKKGSSTVALGLVKNEVARLRELLAIQKNSIKDAEVIGKTNDRLSSALVLAGSWIEKSRSESSDVILKYFEEAASFGSNREEPFYAMGKHYDSLLQAGMNAGADVNLSQDLTAARSVRRPVYSGGQGAGHYSRHVPMVIQNYASTLCNGHSRIFEALPRMLTVWFDYYAGLDDKNNRDRGLEFENEVRDVVRKSIQKIPLYMWMTAIPQLMSRILHNWKIVREELSHILARVLCQFPDVSFWTVVPTSQLKSSVARKKATEDILSLAFGLLKRDRSNAGKERAKAFRGQIHHRLTVLNYFIEICETPGSKERRGHVDNCSNEFAKLNEHLSKWTSQNPIIPTLKSLTVRLPDGRAEEHRPFEKEAVRIGGIDNQVLVMSSLMCPKRITLLGSDGRQYRYLAKRENNGDMRRDSRVVEFLTIMNRLLSEDRECQGKRLQLKSYAVLPLTEETGMIEWVNDLSPLRVLVASEHTKVDGMPTQSAIMKKYESTADKRRFLEEWAMVKFPAVLDKYFVKQFGGGDAQRWLAARNEWTKSCAVWSMSGQIVGLGDRHGENVLLETSSGKCVHVDFAMLFEKGLKLRVPEVVPFRLTQNMVSAMGVCGYEGVFRTVCEVVMRLVRRNADALLSQLESFLYDPLADWSSSQTHGCKAGVVATREGWQARATVKSKLTGMVDSSGIALSIEGQVERLIKDATNLDNLSKMYIWWSAWV